MTPVRVVEASGGIAGAYGARVLASFGADVISLRLEGEAQHTDQSPQARVLREFLAMGKRSVLTTTDQVHEHLSDADLLVIGDTVGDIERWQLDIDHIRDEFPQLTVTTITPFGCTGPLSRRPATELTLQAMSGLLAMSGSASREPLMRSLRQSKYATGLNAAYTSLAAVYAAKESRYGTLIDIAQREVLASELVLNAPTYAYVGAVQGRLPESKDIFFTGAPMQAADGLVTMQINNRTGVGAFAELLNEPRLTDERFSTAEGRLRHAGELTSIVQNALRAWEGRAFFEAAAAEGLLAGFVQTAEHLLECPQLDAREFWGEVESSGETFRVPDRLVNVTRFHERHPAAAVTA